MLDDPKKEIKVYIVGYITFLLCMFICIILTGCPNSNLISSQVKPDSTHNSTIFHEIVDQDNKIHWYVKLYEGNHWCYYHHRYEEVRKNVRRK